MIKLYNSLNSGKKEQITSMFNHIAHRYDFLNHFLSFGLDRKWREKAIGMLKDKNPDYILDVATGTGDFAIQAAALYPVKIVGIDVSAKMLDIAKLKIRKRRLEYLIEISEGDAERINFPENSFEAVTIAFGVRNFENLTLGLKEMYRILKTGGVALILEFSNPSSYLFKTIYHFYFCHVLPFLGRFISGDKAAYSYLPESVKNFPEGTEFMSIMKTAGFTEIKQIKMTGGIVSVYYGKKV